MKSKIKVLQVASFDGNIGDIANHTGFRQFFEKYSKFNFEFTNMEMRNFYQTWALKKFDESFAEEVNKYDLLVLGGGGFFVPNIIQSSTGVTIDLNDTVLQMIKTPILFNCLSIGGRDVYEKECGAKFELFLDKLTENRSKYFITVRNDGSYERINSMYNSKFKGSILKIPDGGFFTEPVNFKHAEIKENFVNIAINLASDQSVVRFPNKDGKISEEEFVEEFASFCNEILSKREDVRLIFVPHLMSDLNIINKVVSQITDRYVRMRVTCATCLNGSQTDGLINFDLYKSCQLVIGMRYHANVVPIGMNIPTLAIFNLEAHVKLYDDLGIEHRCIQSNIKGFSKRLLQKVLETIDNPSINCGENQKIKERLHKENLLYVKKFDEWFISTQRYVE